MKQKTLMLSAAICSLVAFSSCTHYPIAQDVKMVSFDDDVSKGKGIGPITGEDCVWSVVGYRFGGRPTLDRAMANARTQSGGGITDAFKNSKDTLNTNTVRYMTNVSTENDGFNAVIVGKECLVVKGTGYR